MIVGYIMKIYNMYIYLYTHILPHLYSYIHINKYNHTLNHAYMKKKKHYTNTNKRTEQTPKTSWSEECFRQVADL